MSGATSEALGAVAALDDPVRLTLYRHLVSQPGWVDRDHAASAAGISRSLAAYHLDRLLAAGLLEVEYRRPEGRRGPGAGRPAKRYRRSPQAVEVSVPPRRYDVAAELLVRAMAGTLGDRAIEPLAAVAEDFGQHLGAAARGSGRRRTSMRELRHVLRTELQALGFEPREAAQAITLGNCPFAMLARAHPGVVCGMNLALITGLIEGAGVTGARARLEPEDGRCCVVVTDDRIPVNTFRTRVAP
jgi:predicted ArsR family transcriptional regulator